MRLIGAIALVLLTYNTTGYFFYHWALLLVGWIVCIRMAFVSRGALGLLLSVLVLGTLVWMLRDYGILNPDSPSLLAWVL